jgi:hypothetical protein
VKLQHANIQKDIAKWRRMLYNYFKFITYHVDEFKFPAIAVSRRARLLAEPGGGYLSIYVNMYDKKTI